MNHFIENMILKPKRIWNTVKNATDGILVIRLDVLGDMVVTIPFLRELRKNYPHEKITLVCTPAVYNLVELIPYVDRVVTYSLIKGKHRFFKNFIGIKAFAREKFSQEKFSLVVIPSYQAKGVELTMAVSVKAKRLVAYRDGKILGTVVRVRERSKHEVLRCMDLLSAMQLRIDDDRLEVFIDEYDRDFVKKLFKKYQVDLAKQKLVVCLSTSEKKKDWPTEWYAEVCNRLRKKYPLEIILVGTKDTTATYADTFCQLVDNVRNFVGLTTVRQTIAIMERADYHLGGDTGTVHLAAACQMKGIAIYKDYRGADPACGVGADNFSPWRSKIRVLRPVQPLPGCEKECCASEAHCIKQITPDEVYSAMCAVIEDNLEKLDR